MLGLKEKGRYDIKKVTARVKEISEKYGFDIDPNKKIYEMSVSEKQTVEIVKVLYRGADILILDEPTAVLTPQETQKLFAVLRRMRDDGKAIIIITHNEGARLLHYHHHPQARGGNGDLRPRDGSPQGRIHRHRKYCGNKRIGAYRNDGGQKGFA